mgnify:CR=1 FL=1
MELTLKREVFTDKSTIGSLFVNGVFECYILEDPDRGLKQDMPLAEIERLKKYGVTAIPYGKYKVVRTKSERFSLKAGHTVIMPLLLDTPGYAGVRIHIGNKPEDTLGCLLPGRQIGVNCVMESTKATQQLEKKIEGAIANGEQVWITITK